MKSMVKREISIALNPHIEMITQMVVDSYEVLTHRREDKGLALRRDDCLYHRFLRQSGHSAAVRILLSEDWQKKQGIRTYGLFHTSSEGLVATNGTNPRLSNFSPINSKPESISAKIPVDTSVLIVADSLHDGKRIDKIWDFIDSHLRGHLPNLTLVVFLG